MKPIAIWSLVVGGLFLLSAIGRCPLRRFPIAMPTIYLLVGAAIGPWGLGLANLSFAADTKLIEVVAEIAVLISLLTAGLRLKPCLDLYLTAPLPLATVGMCLTIAGVACVGHFGFGLPIGAAILLGAVLAPTDPVLAGQVQVRSKEDTDRLRFALTGEAGLNDGAAFPFVMLALGLMGHHELGQLAWKWWLFDVVWATAAGILSGWGMGWLISRLAAYLRRRTEAVAAAEELLTLALIGLSYGAAMAIGSYGFLAVFAAGVAMRVYAESDAQGSEPDAILREVAEVNEQFERLVEVALVVITGVLLASHWTLYSDWPIALLLFGVIRPIAATIALLGSEASRYQKMLAAGFGIRGIGSLYYLAYAIGEGVSDATAERLSGIVVTTIALSILLHSNATSLFFRAKGEPGDA
ncbi:MAG: cation:proton antiporter [Planctomycetota bacterium]